MKNCSTCSTLTGILRIVTGGIFLWQGIPKLSANPETIEMIGSAGPAFLDSLGISMQLFSTSVWFWLAVAAELIAGLLLLFGFKAKLGAWIALIVLVFIWHFQNWNFIGNIPALIITIGAITVLFKGTGAAALEPRPGSVCHGKCKHHKHDKDNTPDDLEIVDA